MGAMYEADQVLKKQDVGDTIFIAESTKTPFSRLLKRGPQPKQALHEWAVKEYPRRKFTGTIDGKDQTTFGKTVRERIAAYWMLMRSEGYMVTQLAQLTESAGVRPKGEKAMQAMDDGLMLAQQIERQLLGSTDTVNQVLPNTAYNSRAVFSWLAADAQATLPVPQKFRPAAACNYAGTLAAYLPASLEAQLEAMALAKNENVDLTMFAGIKLKSRMSRWTQKVTGLASGEQMLTSYNLNADEKKFMQMVDFFQFDAGEVKVMPSYYLRCDSDTGENTDYTPRSGALVDLSMWELRFAQNPTHKELPDLGGGPRGYHDAVYILVCRNPLGQGLVEISADS